jgi:putative transposase
MQAIRWERGLCFRWNGVSWRIVGAEGLTAVVVQRLADDHVLTLPIADLVDGLERGKVVIDVRPRAPESSPADWLTRVPTSALEAARIRLEIIRPLLELRRVPTAVVTQVAAARQRGTRTIRRWLRAYREGGFEGLLPATASGRRREPQLSDPRVQQVFDHVIEEEYLTPAAPTKAHVIRTVQDTCARQGVPVPPRSTLYGLLGRLAADRVALRREGLAVAESRFLPTPTRFADTAATHPLHMVQVDHTLLDLELIDEETGLSLGRPWLTLGFDVHSRMPWG